MWDLRLNHQTVRLRDQLYHLEKSRICLAFVDLRSSYLSSPGAKGFSTVCCTCLPVFIPLSERRKEWTIPLIQSDATRRDGGKKNDLQTCPIFITKRVFVFVLVWGRERENVKSVINTAIIDSHVFTVACVQKRNALNWKFSGEKKIIGHFLLSLSTN